MPCDIHRPVIHCAAGSSPTKSRTNRPVQINQSNLANAPQPVSVKVITPLPYFGIGRIVDFGRVGAASLWKSDPLFSTGSKEAGLMLTVLRSNLHRLAAQFGTRGRGEMARAREFGQPPSLSTAFQTFGGLGSTAAFASS